MTMPIETHPNGGKSHDPEDKTRTNSPSEPLESVLMAQVLSSVESSGSLNTRMAKGAIWMVVARLGDRTIGLVSIVIMGRLLNPADFGLVAMATAIVAMLELLGSFGFDTVLIQNPAASRSHFDTAWTFNLMFATVTAVALLFIAPLASAFYGEPRLTYVIRWLALAAIVQGFENIGIVIFRKELRFKQEFCLLFARRLIVFSVTIPLAFTLRNYWALVVGVVLSRVMSVILTYVMQRSYRPRLSLSARGELFHFGKWMAIISFLGFLTTRCADFMVGKFSGPGPLGLFNMSNEIANLPTSDLIAPINRAVFPGYSKKAGDLTALRQSYLSVIGIIAILSLPAAFGIAAVADLIVPFMLGPKWNAAIPSLIVLSFYGVLLVFTSNGHYAYLALGRPRIPALLGATQLVILLPLVALGSIQMGALGAALGYLIAQVIFTPITLSILHKTLELRVIELLRVIQRPLIAATVMLAAVRMTVMIVNIPQTSTLFMFTLLLVCVATGVLVYLTMVSGMWWLASKPEAAETSIVKFILERIRLRTHGAV
jgi:lipopolysaccharide exporter